MNDKDKVISGLEHCSEDGCQGCPYETDCNMADGFSDLAKDALELINYQDQHIEAFLEDQEEKIKPVLSDRQYEDRPLHYVRYAFCPSCHQTLSWLYNRKYCGFCGQAVKWND